MPRFGAFEVTRKLGTGGLADVFEGRLADPRPGLPDEPVALKVLRDANAARPVVERFFREGRLLMRHPHAGLPACHALLDAPRPTLVLEKLDGDCLADRMKRGPLAQEVVVRIATEVLEVLSFLHEHGVVHRDVKPGNIQITASGRVVLMDLGLALDPQEPFDVRRGEVLGTYAYMAPEQIAGAGADHRADLYSLGLSLYEAFAGRHPYKARGAAGWLMAHTRGGAQALDGVSPRLGELIARLMDRDPSSRPQTAPMALALLTGHHDTRNALLPPPLVGRAAAIGALEGALDQRTVVVLQGEPGCGTSRLAREAWELAIQWERPVAGARCNGRGSLRKRVERALGQPLETVESAVLILEDLHRAGTADLRWLSGLKGHTVIGTSRRDVALGGRNLQVRDLNMEEVRLLMVGMLGGPPPAGFAERIHRFTGGLAAAVVFTVRDYFDRGALTWEGQGPAGLVRWRLNGALRMGRGNSLELIWGRRLQALQIRERRVLNLLAVAARPLPVRICAKVSGVGDPLALHRLSRAGLACIEGDQVCVARPALGALAASAMDPTRRRALHGALAMALLAEPAGPWRQELLSWHMAMGAESKRAAKALIGFASRTRDEGRPEEARQVLLRVQTMDMDGPTALRAALVRGQLMLDLSDPTGAGDALNAAARLAESLEDRELLRRVQLEQARVGMHRGQVVEALERAEALLRHKVEPRALVVRGTAQMLLGQGAAAVASFQEVIELAEPVTSAMAMGGLGSLAAHAGRFGVGIRHTSQQVRFTRRNGTASARVDTLVQLGLLHALAGDLDRSTQLMDEARICAERTALSHLVALAGVGRARLALAVGDLEVVEELLLRHAEAARNDGSLLHRVQWHSCRLELTLLRGDDAAALAGANRLLELATTASWEGARAYHAGLVAALRANHLQLDEAADALEHCGDRLRLGRLRVHAARIGGDPGRVDAAVAAARKAGDVLLRLDALHLSGGTVAAAEARVLAFAVLQQSSGYLRDQMSRRPSVVWALTTR